MEPLNFGLLKEWLEEKKFFLVKDALAKRNEVDIAEFLEELPPERMAVVFRISYLGGYVFGFGIIGIWMGVLGDQVSRFLFASTRFRAGKWTKIKI